ncbi:hypothetical protein JTE90_000706 [Oedothorax gibbosus]|uniref:Uncharacterized protein n=1 Tax=Oedothorax gibbosus TaxID=931172 RepID=A0AAV6UNN1_9ARAC|nr:hypothetical protein JTE90_000706 [Oedothorax gibbosus]
MPAAKMLKKPPWAANSLPHASFHQGSHPFLSHPEKKETPFLSGINMMEVRNVNRSPISDTRSDVLKGASFMAQRG